MCDGFVKTEFKTVVIANTPTSGIPIGLGKCKAVRLKLNGFTRNGGGAYINTPLFIYYGDAQSQEVELCIVDKANMVDQGYTPLIYCRDLSEVFIRFDVNGGPSSAIVQVIVYS